MEENPAWGNSGCRPLSSPSEDFKDKEPWDLQGESQVEEKKTY